MKFTVRAAFTSYGNIVVEAKDKDEAMEIARDIDGGDFISEDDYISGEFEIVSAEPVNDDNK